MLKSALRSSSRVGLLIGVAEDVGCGLLCRHHGLRGDFGGVCSDGWLEGQLRADRRQNGLYVGSCPIGDVFTVAQLAQQRHDVFAGDFVLAVFSDTPPGVGRLGRLDHEG